MKVLVIDSHKGSSKDEQPQNLHWRNAKQIAALFDADLIWSYPTVNDDIKADYDKIIMVHGSQYSFVDKLWITNSPNADLYYVTNEYNLGEPRMLWPIVKAGRKYSVIANHSFDISKIVTKYTNDWHVVNLNALCYEPFMAIDICEFADLVERQGIVYYGSFRKGREKYFKKYLSQGKVQISTHPKNEVKFREIGVNGPFIPRIEWPPKGETLCNFKASLYLEDEVTHKSYNFLANRFYEALNHNTYPLLSIECMGTANLSGYDFSYFLDDASKLDLDYYDMIIPVEWHEKATQERLDSLQQILEIVTL